MNPHLKKNIGLPVAGIVLGLGFVLYGWTHFSGTGSLEKSMTGPAEGNYLPAEFSSSGSGRAGADSSGPEKKTDFFDRAESLKSEISAGGGNPAVHRERIRQLLVDWAKIDPEAALSYALSSDAEDSVEGLFFAAADAALTTWAKQNPERARHYVEQQAESPRWAAELGPAMMRVYAAKESGKAREWVRNGFKDDSGELRPVIAQELVSILCEQGRKDEVSEWLSEPQVAQCSYAQKATVTYAAELARGNIKEALAFSKELPRGSMSRGLALQETLQVWTRDDAAQAYSWISARLASEQAPAENVSGSGKEKLLPAEAYTADELDYAISGYVIALAKTSTKEAVESAKGIRNPSLRQRIGQEAALPDPKKSS